MDGAAGAVAGTGLLRLGHFRRGREEAAAGRYWQAGLPVAGTLLAEPYVSLDDGHQGLLLHTIYRRPRGWDHIPAGSEIPNGESCMWGDYHLLELALYLHRAALEDTPCYTFYGPSQV